MAWRCNPTSRSTASDWCRCDPPRALTSFISRAPGIRDISGGTGTIFYAENLEMLTNLSSLVGNSVQFSRVGPGMAARLNIAPEPPLMRFIMLDKMVGPPRDYIDFNRAV